MLGLRPFACGRKISCGGYARARFGVVEFCSKGLDIPTPRMAATQACRKADGSPTSTRELDHTEACPRTAAATDLTGAR